jgi:hypothetical protein
MQLLLSSICWTQSCGTYFSSKTTWEASVHSVVCVHSEIASDDLLRFKALARSCSPCPDMVCCQATDDDARCCYCCCLVNPYKRLFAN